MGGLADRIRYALANALRDDHTIDPMRELADHAPINYVWAIAANQS